VYAKWYPVDNNSEHYKAFIHNMDNIFANNHHNESQLGEADGLFVKIIWPSVEMLPPPHCNKEDVDDSKPSVVELVHDTGMHDAYEVADGCVDGTNDGGADDGSNSSDSISGKGHHSGYYQKVPWNPLHPYE